MGPSVERTLDEPSLPLEGGTVGGEEVCPESLADFEPRLGVFVLATCVGADVPPVTELFTARCSD